MRNKNKTSTATESEARPVLMPKLRFPEFLGEQGWLQKTGDYLFDQINERNHEPGLPVLAITQEHGAIPRHMIDYHVSVTEKSIESYKVVHVGDFIISLRSFQGGIEYSQYNGTCSPAYVILRRRVEGSNEYFKHYLKTDRFIQILTKNLEGLRDGKMISYSQFSELILPTPTPLEQQKIANCLTSLDNMITAQARKVDALKTHKKGLMQQLFPREGETQPRLRFPEFREAGEWEVFRLKQIGKVIRGASPRPKGDPRYYNGPVPRLMVQDVTRDGKWITPSIDSLTEEGARLSRPCPAGTLTIVCSGNVGVVSFLAVDACIHDGFLALIDIDESIAIKDFLFHSLSTLRQQFEKGATHGGVFTNLTTSGIDQFEIKCPDTDEQQRIASYLTTLDTLITTETQKLEALKTHKKGLMQQLFPSPEEAEQ
jgi:type I restriction enzyme, S subunit